MIVIIKKKQVKEFVGSIRKIVIRFILLTSFVFWLASMVVFYPLTDIDDHIKVIYIDYSHIKLLRESLKYWFFTYL